MIPLSDPKCCYLIPNKILSSKWLYVSFDSWFTWSFDHLIQLYSFYLLFWCFDLSNFFFLYLFYFLFLIYFFAKLFTFIFLLMSFDWYSLWLLYVYSLGNHIFFGALNIASIHLMLIFKPFDPESASIKLIQRFF